MLFSSIRPANFPALYSQVIDLLGQRCSLFHLCRNLFHVLFLIIGLYDIMSAVYLFHLAVDFAQIFLLCNEEFL